MSKLNIWYNIYMKKFLNNTNVNVKLTLRLVNLALICLILALIYSIHPFLLYVSGVTVQFIMPIFIALIFAMATYPLINYFKFKRNWNNKISKAISIVIVMTILIMFFAILIPLLINFGTTTFPKLKDVYGHVIVPFFQKYGLDVSNVMKYLNFSNILTSITSVGSSFLVVMILYLFIVIDIERIRSFIKKIILRSKNENFIKFSTMFDVNFKNYIKALVGYAGIAIIYYGIVILLLSLTWTHANFLNYPWYFLAILFGVFVIIPYIGPVIGVALTSLTMLNYGNSASIVMFIGLTIATQIDLNLIQLKIIGNKLKLNPLVILISILLSSSLLGFSGILITPILLVIIKTLFDLYETKINQLNEYTGEENDNL